MPHSINTQSDTPTDDSTLNRYMALRALRENIFAQNPVRYNQLDVLEDLPGDTLKTVGSMFNDVPPSLGLIAGEKEEREKQIQEALKRIKQTREGNSLGKEMLHSAGSMAAGAAPAALAFSLIPGLGRMSPIGLPKVLSKLYGKIRPTSYTSSLGKVLTPSTEIGLKDLLPSLKFEQFTNPARRSIRLKQLAQEIGMTAGGAGILGAGVPLVAGTGKFSDKDLEDAANTMRENPYLTSLPGGDLTAALHMGEKRHSLSRDIAVNAALGAISTPLGLAFGRASRYPFELGMKALTGGIKGNRTVGNITKRYFSPLATSNYYKNPALVGGAIGGALGGLQNLSVQDLDNAAP